MKSLEPTIASTRSRRSVDRPNYALDVGEDEEEGNYIKRDLLYIFSHRFTQSVKRDKF